MLSAERSRTVESQRRRIWGLCYRMTGDAAAAEDLAQDSIVHAIERGAQASDETFEGWLYRVTTTTCLDWLRRRRVERTATSIADPVELEGAPFSSDESGESRLLRREDLRLAIVTTLQALAPRQRAVLVLRDVLDRSTAETAEALGITAGNVKVLLHRARARLEEAHRGREIDAPVDGAVVERFARALESGDLDALVALLADEVWGLVDDGLGRRRPTLGKRAVSRQWRNALARYGKADTVTRLRVNGEPALGVLIGEILVAAIHLETRRGRVVSIRVLRDPVRLSRLLGP